MKRHINMKLMAAEVLIVGITTLSGCASPPPASYIVLLENPSGGTGQVIIRGSKGEQVIDQSNASAPLDGSVPPAPVDPLKFKNDFAAVLAARPILPMQYLLYFESGGASLTAESQALLPKILQDVLTRPAADVSIIGHTDTTDTFEANQVLSLKRAEAIADLLLKSGMKPFALLVTSHGERNLLVATPDNTPEPRNRRVEVSVR